ncbi:hypothetical protein [Rhodococcus sp. NPDC058514]|uniref:hypothetical protein n=1 Tax=unclassified Rhodococcus (in: high G+C Gram-positive bacteria) TaxID=192944 RepID=UPI0036601A00
MSHTDKTDPIVVKLWTGALNGVVVHDHRDGRCDLPRSIAEERDRPTHDCGVEHLYSGINACCCPLCRQPALRRADRASARLRDRMARESARRAWNSGDHDEADGVPPRPRR